MTFANVIAKSTQKIHRGKSVLFYTYIVICKDSALAD